MKPNLKQALEKNWGKMESYSIQSSEATADFLLQCLSLDAGDYIICDPLVPAYFLKAVKLKNVQVIFIDLSTTLGNIDLDLLENFLSLSTLINEKDELIYRRDERPIKGIISSTRFNDPKDLQRFLFTAQRYYLKSLTFTGLNDLLSSEANQYYQADLMVSKIQYDQLTAYLVIKPQQQNRIPGMSGAAKVIRMPTLPDAAIVSLEDKVIPENTVPLQPEEPATRSFLQLPFFIPGHATVLAQNRADWSVYLTAKGFYLLPPGKEKGSVLKQSIFLSRSKAGQQFFDQNIKVLITTPKEIVKLKEVIEHYLKNTTETSAKSIEG